MVMDALLPLQRLTAAGIAVFPQHHPRKESCADGRSARGTGALSAWADILMELHWHRPDVRDDRRRRLLAWSRHDATPGSLLIERTADGADYVPCAESDPEPEDDPIAVADSPLWDLLEDTYVKQTRRDILNRWPKSSRPPSPANLWRLLERAVADGKLRREGTGVRTDPFRYWRPELEQLWQTNVVARCLQASADTALRIQATKPFGFSDGLDIEKDEKQVADDDA